MKYSSRHILLALNDNIFTKDDMKEQYKFSDLPILKHMTDSLYTSEMEYNKLSNKFTLDRNHALNLPTYLPTSIQEIISDMKIVKYKTRFFIGNRIFDIVLHMDATKKHMHHDIDEHFKKIYMWLCVASKYASPQCSKYVKINLYLTHHKKKLPSPYSVIDREHANTAFTTSCKTETEIDIFREEEWFKTLIHETFHNLGMDFSANGSQHTNELLYRYIPIQVDFRLYEAYTECWAEIIHSLFVAFFHLKKQGSASMYSTFNTVLNNERRFAVFQCEKVLNHYNMKLSDLFKQTTLATVRRNNYKENTNVLAYYVFKMIFMYNAKDFILWTSKNNRTSINFNNKTDPKKEARLVNFIKKHIADTTLSKMLDKSNKYLKENQNKKNMTTQTLRMTVYEIV